MRTIIKFVLTFFAALAAIGFTLSLALHFLATMGRMPPFPGEVWVLFLGVFVTAIPSIIAGQAISRQFKAKDQWEASLRGCPKWIRRFVNVFGYYAMATFGVFMIWLEPAIRGKSGDTGMSPEFT